VRGRPFFRDLRDGRKNITWSRELFDRCHVNKREIRRQHIYVWTPKSKEAAGQTKRLGRECIATQNLGKASDTLSQRTHEGKKLVNG